MPSKAGYTLTPAFDRDLPLLPQAQSKTYYEHTETASSQSRAPSSTSANHGLGWKPLSLRVPVLLAMAAVSVGLAVVLQLLSEKSARDGGIIFAPTVHQFSTLDTFSYLYLPVVIATIYGLLWAWIDLDAKRLQPFYSMSRPGGASAEESVLLDYPTQFVAVAPIRALNHRHWTVFATTCVVLLTAAGITPFTGSIFNAGTITLSSPATVVDSGVLIPTVQQAAALTATIFDEAYEQIWLNGSIPPFTKNDLVVMPFDIAQHKASLFPDSVVTVETLGYFTALTCTRGNYTLLSAKELESANVPSGSAYVSNGKGCTIILPGTPEGGSAEVGGSASGDSGAGNSATSDSGSGNSPPDETEPRKLASGRSMSEQVEVRYIGWYPQLLNKSQPDTQLQSLSDLGSPCPSTFQNTFLGYWQPSSDPQEGTYLFCDTSYDQQSGKATVSISNNTLIDWLPSGPLESLPSTVFDSSSFNQFLGSGFAEYATHSSADLQVAAQIRVFSQYPEVSLNDDISVYGLGMSDAPLSTLQDPDQLAGVFQNTHKLLFPLGMQSLVASTQSTKTQAGTWTRQTGVISVSSTFSIIAEVSLLVAAIIAVVLAAINYNRRPSTVHDIPSLAAVGSLADRSLLAFLAKRPIDDKKSVSRAFTDHRYSLRYRDSNTGNTKLVVESSRSAAPAKQSTESTHHQKLFRPVELTTTILLLFLVANIMFMLVLIILKSKIQLLNGLPLPSRSSFVRELLLNYLPTLVGTALEAVWVVITRTYSSLLPFSILRRGQSTVKKALGTKFTSLPTQMVLGSALICGQNMLALLCSVAILGNVLSVGLSGLFLVQPVDVLVNQTYRAVYTPNLAGYSQPNPFIGNGEDAVYITQMNLMHRRSLPPWVTESQFFLPFQTISDEFQSAAVRTAKTVGFSLDVQCGLYTGETNLFGPYPITFIAEVHALNGTSTTCTFGGANSIGMQPVSDQAPHTPLALEENGQFGQIGLGGPTDHDGFESCGNILWFNWYRSGPNAEGPIIWPGNATVPPITGINMLCPATITSKWYEVSVDSNDIVLSANQPAEEGPSLAALNDTLQAIYLSLPGYFLIEGGDYWHSNTSSTNFFNDMLTVLRNSTDAVNPALAPPDPQTLAPVMEDALRRTFAIALGLNTQNLEPVSKTSVNELQGFVTVSQQRIFFAPYLFQLTISLLAFNVLVALLVLVRRPGKFLPRPPDTVASMLAFMEGSSILKDFSEGRVTLEELLGDDTRTVGYGKFVGADGMVRTGIERHPFVVLMDSENWWDRLWKRLGRARKGA